MKIQLTYVAVTHGPKTYEMASRFVGSYLENPPGVEHETIVVCNGGPLETELASLFLPMDAKFLPRENDAAWDVGAFQTAATQTSADMMVCMGESCYFWKPGWLERMAAAWKHFGPGMYGFFATHAVRAHMNTSAFCCAPAYLRQYSKVLTNPQRYAFEHGPDAMWRQLQRKRIPTVYVTWSGFYPPRTWRDSKNGINSGDQSDCMVRCNHLDRYDAADFRTKQMWKMGADKPYV